MKSPLVGIGIDLDWPLRYHYDTLRGVLAEGRRLGWTCRIHPGLETSTEVDELPEKYDGIIARASPALVQCCRRQGVPLVNVWANLPEPNVPTVVADYAAIGRVAAEHLLMRGFRTFGFLCRENDVTARGGFSGVQSALEQHEGELHVLEVSVPKELVDWQQLRSATAKWLEQLPLPAAVIASDHIVARNFVDHCQENNLLVPDDIAVISCKENKLVCSGIEPELTSIETNFGEVGEAAVRALASLMAGDDLAEVRQCVSSVLEVHERFSTDVQPVGDRTVARALRYVWDHSHHPISVAEVARSVQVTRRRLERRFRKETNQSVNDKIIESRIERAKRILINSDDTIKQVAKAAGFSSGIRLAQVFAQRVGMTPTAYRAQGQ